MSTSTGTGAVGEVAERWVDDTRGELSALVGAARADELVERYVPLVPAGYDELNWPTTAAVDLVHLDALGGQTGAIDTAMLHFADAAPNEWRFRVYVRGATLALADLLPLLDQLGFRALDERSFTFRPDSAGAIRLHDVGVAVDPGVELTDDVRAEVQRTFTASFDATVEVDSLNRLVLLAGLTARQVEVLRAYTRYLRQIGFPFGQAYIEATLCRWATISAQLVGLFASRFDPLLVDADQDAHAARRATLVEALDGVPSLDDDRTLRAIVALIDATVRTNAYRPADDDTVVAVEPARHRPVLSFKFDGALVPDLPEPRPKYEIWVCSPRVEGVHLRDGMIARGGLRWSDRREDFRTEVLGLVKAQIVKNAVIVPTGAKGGFVLKRPPAEQDAFRAEGLACYRLFVGGMLDLTDNIVDGTVVPPPSTVRYDGDDPYLVVAADKGTASFSDVANEISAAYGFWLGDAFASGGSAGYDHKEMGITARGAWESVRRHAKSIGKDVDRDQLTVVGIGDMSGDVFGNGLLCSEHVQLVAAFDHRHVFLDPDPDPASSFAERRRLFELPRSSWADYDPALISPGGGVYPRTQKRIEISARARERLGTEHTTFTPAELVSTVLRAPVDLLWNGGIGTYVKASTETDADVGDRANDVLRVDGAQLRCRMVGEGGNLGLTQRGRVEYALAGGLVNTDAIDNSAGVDCSDHEVNIKIVLGAAIADGTLAAGERDALLATMTDEVAEQVLDDNRAQTLALAVARRQTLLMANVHARYLDTLEAEGWLDRGLEFLPTTKQLAERQSHGVGLTTPEFAVLMAYTKSANAELLERSDTPDDPYLEPELVHYFPAELRERFATEIAGHRLRREIVATQLANQMVNLSGISFDHRMTEDTGAGVVEVTGAWVAARDIFDFVRQWEELERLDGVGTLRPSAVKVDVQIELFLELRRMVERGALWLLRHRRPPLDIATTVAEFREPMAELLSVMDAVVVGRQREHLFANEAARLAARVPEDIAQRSTLWPLMHTGFDVIQLAERTGEPVGTVAGAYWAVFDVLDVGWVWDAIGALPRADRWQTQARSALRDDLLVALADLADDALYVGSAEAWAKANERVVGRAMAMFTEIRRTGNLDVGILSVALRQLRNLSLITQRPA